MVAKIVESVMTRELNDVSDNDFDNDAVKPAGWSSALQGKHLLVCGAAGGLGAATARACLMAGARLYLSDLGCDREGKGEDPRRVAELVDQLRGLARCKPRDPSGASHEPSVFGAAHDLSRRGGGRAAVESAWDALGSVDGLVYAAGITGRSALLRLRTEDLDQAYQVHVRGMMSAVQAFAQKQRDREQKCGTSIVVFSDPRVWFGVHGQGAMAMTAGATSAFVRSAALELRRLDVRINAVAPLARTRMNEDLPMFQRVSRSSLRAEDVAPVCAFLLSDAARDISGQVLHVAGPNLSMTRTVETPPVSVPSSAQADPMQVWHAWRRLQGAVEAGE